MIHYHGGPLGKAAQSHEFFRGRHSLVSFQHRGELEVMAEVSHSFIFDNGSFSVWKSGKTLNVGGYYEWVDMWRRHPGFDWCLIPDVIEGSEADNDSMVGDWPFGFDGVPVWHLNESLGRLETLAESWPRIAFGSTSGIEPNSKSFWLRMAEIMDIVCDDKGRPISKLHGLRMMNPAIFRFVPLASADSCTCAINAFMPGKQFGAYLPKRESQRANIIADRIEAYNSPPLWDKSNFPVQEKLL